jgi:geranylgeranyl diphosphate synthase, type I
VSDLQPHAIAAVRPFIDAQLATFVKARRDQLLEIGEELAPVLHALDTLLVGGKRIRPAFCYWGWRGAGGPEQEGIYAAAASLELLQACALIHDDVIDNSDTRRGEPAAHRRHAALHRQEGWDGPSAAFGQGAAILLGDLCLAWCEDMYTASGLAPESLNAGRVSFDAMRTEVMAGQYLDMLEQARGLGTVDSALRVMNFKAAKYTVERPLLLGAALAGGTPQIEALYTSYGRAIGLAFQLRDDVLGVFGDPEQTGKPAGDDLREGKRTVLVAETLQRAHPEAANRFRDLLGEPELGRQDVAWMRGVIEECGALSACEERIAAYAGQARDALISADTLLAEEARSALGELVEAATTRSA